MSLGHEHGLVLIGLAGPMDVVNLSLSLFLSLSLCSICASGLQMCIFASSCAIFISAAARLDPELRIMAF